MKRIADAPPDPGDDTGILRAYLHWVGSVAEVTRSPAGAALGCVYKMDEHWNLVFAIDRGPSRRQRHFVQLSLAEDDAEGWPLVKLAPGVWDIPTSIHIEGQFHGFVTLLGVPSPAPWEQTP